MVGRRPLVAGNWKMNGVLASSAQVSELSAWAAHNQLGCDVLICPPATLLIPFAEQLRGSRIALGAQNCSAVRAGALTGEVSAEMLVDAGARYILVGHSERRAGQGERDTDVSAKAGAVHASGACAIICVGETAGERRLGLTLEVVGRQLRGSVPHGANAANTVIAYEPVWAIGAGVTPSIADIGVVHAFIRSELQTLLGAAECERVRILYGGSVKAANAADIFRIDHVDGGLVGGASLNARDFIEIASAYLPHS